MKLTQVIALVLIVTQLQGCVALVVTGAASAVGAVADKRSLGSQIDDNTIEIQAGMALGSAEGVSENTHISAISVNGNVLVVGQSPNELLRDRAIAAIKKVDGVKQVRNQITIGTNTSILTRTNDSWLTSKVKFQLVTADEVDGNNIKVVTENGEVFLMGLVTAKEANRAAEIARNISGVVRVIKMFELVDN